MGRGRRARSIWTAVAVAVLGLLVVATVSAGSVIPTPIGDDPYTDGGSGHQHKTQLEPDSFAFGQTIVALTQSGRWFGGGGSSNLVFSTSQNGGRTWTTGGLPGTTVNSGGPWPRISDPSVAYDPQDDVWLALGLGIDAGGSGHILLVNRSTDGGLTWSNPVVAGHRARNASGTRPGSPATRGRRARTTATATSSSTTTAPATHMSMVTSTDGGVTWGPCSRRRLLVGSGRPAGRAAERQRDRAVLERRRRGELVPLDERRHELGRLRARRQRHRARRGRATSARSRCRPPRSPETARSTSPGRTAGSAPAAARTTSSISTTTGRPDLVGRDADSDRPGHQHRRPLHPGHRGRQEHVRELDAHRGRATTTSRSRTAARARAT